MPLNRRIFIKQAGLGLAALVGPWSLSARSGYAATASTPALRILTPSEYKYINKLAPEVIADAPVLTGQVDVALNIDRFFAEVNASPDFLIMLRFLRLIRLSDPVFPVIKRFAPLTAEDVLSFKKTVCALGYYSDANGEADLPAEKRIVWPRVGYKGPKPKDWWPPESEEQIDPSVLKDRIQEEGL